MSRLSSRRQQAQFRRLLLIGGCIILLFIAAFQVGLKSIINATLFVNTFKSPGDSTSQSSLEDSFFGTFSLDDPPGATREAKLIVRGNTNGYEKMIPFVNGLKQKPVEVKKDSFEIVLTSLESGENTFYVLATTNNGKHTKKSSSYTVVYRNKPPEIEFETPHDKDAVSRPELAVKGKTDKGVTLRINRMPVVVNWEGKFQTTIQLKEGENTIEAVVIDDAGNTSDKKIMVTYRRDE